MKLSDFWKFQERPRAGKEEEEGKEGGSDRAANGKKRRKIERQKEKRGIRPAHSLFAHRREREREILVVGSAY